MQGRKTLIGLGLLAVIASLPSLAFAHWAYTGTMTKAEILSKVIRNTVMGTTPSGSAYAEYYTPDGIVHVLTPRREDTLPSGPLETMT